MNKVIAALAMGVLVTWAGSLVARSTEVDKNANPTKGREYSTTARNPKRE